MSNKTVTDILSAALVALLWAMIGGLLFGLVEMLSNEESRSQPGRSLANAMTAGAVVAFGVAVIVLIYSHIC